MEHLRWLLLKVVENTPGIKPTSVLYQENTILSKAIDMIVKKYSSKLKIKTKFEEL